MLEDEHPGYGGTHGKILPVVSWFVYKKAPPLKPFRERRGAILNMF
tara:strand:- start:276 stop:413 length:138 start_codon:yes stop_codon:yes gene_type:complete